MHKFLKIFLIIYLIFTVNLPSFAQDGDIYRYEEQKQLTPQEVNMLKYKMGRITVRQELGKWQIIQGINTELTDVQLLNLVNSANIATERLKSVESKQTMGSAFVLGGLLLAVVGGLFAANIFKVQNGLYYGIGGIAGGLGLAVIGNSISPLIADENDHVINIEEAKNAAGKYNAQLRKSFNLPDNID